MRPACAPAREAGGAPAILLSVSETGFRLPGGGAIRLFALLLNTASFVAGVYFVAQPRDRRDVIPAAGVTAAAVLSGVALTAPARGELESFVVRLRRIALFVNAILVPVALAIVALDGPRDWRRVALHAGLVAPPLATLIALRRRAAS